MANKMVILKGREFNCTFVIKANGTVVAVELDPTDTGTMTFSTIGPDPEILIPAKSLTLGDSESMLNGEMFLSLTAEETALLPFDNKFGEDGFPLSATVKGILDINTASEGKIYATVPEIFVDYTGE